MDTQLDVKNKLKIKNLVKNYFSLTEKSQKLFNHRLLYEPNVAPELENVIGDDQRAFFEVSGELKKELDPGWRKFCDYFNLFIQENDVTYEEYANNLINIEGQQLRTRKAIVNYYVSNLHKLTPGILDNLAINFEDKFQGRVRIKNLAFDENQKQLMLTYFGVDDYIEENNHLFIEMAGFYIPSNSELLYEKNFPFLKEKVYLYKSGDEYLVYYQDKTIIITQKYNEEVKRIIERKVQQILESIGTVKLSSRKVYAVLSANFTDWLLASSGENWGSCINLESTHAEAFWTGLPGIIGDKSRFLFYLTDGTYKEYRGIKTYKILSRSWITIARDKKKAKPTNRKTYFVLSPSYPIENNNLKILQSITENTHPNVLVTGTGRYDSGAIVGKYYGEAIFQKTNRSDIEILTTIYGDINTPRLAKSGDKARYNSFEYFFTSFNTSGRVPIVIDKRLNKQVQVEDGECSFRINGGLTSLIERNVEIKHHFEAEIDEYDEDDDDFIDDDFEEHEEVA